jgi:hypothetical protein
MKTIVTPRSGVSDWLVGMVEMVQEAELSGAARGLLKRADGWWTVAYALPATWRKAEEAVSVVLRGWSGERQLMAVWINGKAECAYWWTREHEAWADLPRELVRWTTPQPTPVKVSFRELSLLVQECGKVEA